MLCLQKYTQFVNLTDEDLKDTSLQYVNLHKKYDCTQALERNSDVR